MTFANQWVPDGVIFDLDGTLVDSAPEIASALNCALIDHGIDTFSLKEVKAFIGKGAPLLVRRALAARAIVNHKLEAAILDELLATYEVSFDRTRLYHGVIEMLEAVPVPMAVCTNKPAKATAAVLQHFGLTRYFAAVVCGDTLPVRKPDPAPLWHAAGLIGAQKPVMVGDSEVDSQTAEAAGVPFVFFEGGYCNGPVKPQLSVVDHIDLQSLLADPIIDFVFP